MSYPTYEIAKVVVSDEYLADPTIADSISGALTDTPGFIGGWKGLDVQEPQYLWLVVAWESIEHHHALMQDKERYPAMIEVFQKLAKDVVFMHHVKFSSDLTEALAWPTTEIVLCTLKESADRAEFQETLQKLLAQLEKDVPSSDLAMGGWGPVIEDERKFMVSHGWHSLERSHAAICAAPEFLACVTAIQQLSVPEVRFVNLVKHT